MQWQRLSLGLILAIVTCFPLGTRAEEGHHCYWTDGECEGESDLLAGFRHLDNRKHTLAWYKKCCPLQHNVTRNGVTYCERSLPSTLRMGARLGGATCTPLGGFLSSLRLSEDGQCVGTKGECCRPPAKGGGQLSPCNCQEIRYAPQCTEGKFLVAANGEWRRCLKPPLLCCDACDSGQSPERSTCEKLNFCSGKGVCMPSRNRCMCLTGWVGRDCGDWSWWSYLGRHWLQALAVAIALCVIPCFIYGICDAGERFGNAEGELEEQLRRADEEEPECVTEEEVRTSEEEEVCDDHGDLDRASEGAEARAASNLSAGIPGASCCVCCDRGADAALVPCGHAAFCHPCSKRLRLCPICRVPIAKRQRIYLPNESSRSDCGWPS